MGSQSTALVPQCSIPAKGHFFGQHLGQLLAQLVEQLMIVLGAQPAAIQAPWCRRIRVEIVVEGPAVCKGRKRIPSFRQLIIILSDSIPISVTD